jgi:quinol-cytochrome oxidoreductase complex cytochrome b subunit
MLVIVGTALAGLVGAGLLFLGLLPFRFPQAATGFGIPDTPVDTPAFQAWLTVKAVRDLASGIFIFILIIGGSPALLGWFMLAATVIPAGDALIVLRSGGSRSVAYGTHGTVAAGLPVIGLLLLLG